MLSGLSVQIASQWIPREAHLRANLLSRFVDKDDWSLNPEVSPSWIANGVRNQLTVLRLTAMLRFQELIVRSCLRAVAPSMPFPWIGEALITGFVLLSLVVDVIKRARECRSVGTLIVPEWRSAFLRPLLKPFLPEFACFVLLFAGQVRCFTETSNLFSLIVRNLLYCL